MNVVSCECVVLPGGAVPAPGGEGSGPNPEGGGGGEGQAHLSTH